MTKKDFERISNEINSLRKEYVDTSPQQFALFELASNLANSFDVMFRNTDRTFDRRRWLVDCGFVATLKNRQSVDNSDKTAL